MLGEAPKRAALVAWARACSAGVEPSTVIPGRAEGASPESITRTVVMDSGPGPSGRPGMTTERVAQDDRDMLQLGAGGGILQIEGME
jgi:hypothetical protein